jgi:hypothetical protein
VPANDSDDAMQAFVDEFDLGALTHLVDDDGAIWGRFGVAYQPAWAFIDRAGGVEVVAGAIPDDELDARLEALAGS